MGFTVGFVCVCRGRSFVCHNSSLEHRFRNRTLHPIEVTQPNLQFDSPLDKDSLRMSGVQIHIEDPIAKGLVSSGQKRRGKREGDKSLPICPTPHESEITQMSSEPLRESPDSLSFKNGVARIDVRSQTGVQFPHTFPKRRSDSLRREATKLGEDRVVVCRREFGRRKTEK